MSDVTVSHHFLRRRARAKERKLEAQMPDGQFRVEKAQRGPYRWRVVRVK